MHLGQGDSMNVRCEGSKLCETDSPSAPILNHARYQDLFGVIGNVWTHPKNNLAVSIVVAP